MTTDTSSKEMKLQQEGESDGQLKSGLNAVRDLRSLSKQHANTRTELEELQKKVDDDSSTLAHRIEIENAFDKISVTQQAKVQQTQAQIAACEKQRETLAAESEQLSAQLEALKLANEEKISPLRERMDTAQNDSDEASLALANARRAVKAAEGASAEATSKRDSSITSVNRALDGAQERLRIAQNQYDKLKADPQASAEALEEAAKKAQEANAQAEEARKEAERVSAQVRSEAHDAQEKLFSLRQEVTAAEQAADAAKREALTSRNEHDTLYKQCRAAEQEISAAIDERSAQSQSLQKQIETLTEQLNEQQAVLDEANDIHTTPELTSKLYETIQADKAKLAELQREVTILAQSEQSMRNSTKGKRTQFYLVSVLGVIAIVLIVMLVVWLITSAG